MNLPRNAVKIDNNRWKVVDPKTRITTFYHLVAGEFKQFGKCTPIPSNIAEAPGSAEDGGTK